MHALKLNRLPDSPVQRILILRTARTAQVQWALEQLRDQYPQATFAVLGTQLRDNALFDEFKKFEVEGAWLKLAGVRRFKREIRSLRLDLAVMVLNGDGGPGYEKVSRVMKGIPAKMKLVAGYNQRWHRWEHSQFCPGSLLRRWVCGGIEYLLYPLVFLYMLGKSSRPAYMPDGQGRQAPEYEQ